MRKTMASPKCSQNKQLPYSGKVWWGKSLANWASRSFGEEKFGECR